MADPVVTPGKETTEFSVTKLLMWIGTAVTLLSAATESVSEIMAAVQKIPTTSTGPALWMALIGAAIAVIPAVYYKFTRLQLKRSAIEAAAAGTSSDAKAALDAA